MDKNVAAKPVASPVPGVNKERVSARRLTGVVVKDKMNKTRVIAVKRIVKNTFYHKSLVRDRRFFVHDEKNESKVGDKIIAYHTRPISKNKHFRLLKIIGKKVVS